MFWLTACIHLSDIGSFNWEILQRHNPCHVLSMSMTGMSMTISFACWVRYVTIGCRHSFIRYWYPVLAKTTAAWTVPYPQNEYQRRVNNLERWILTNSCSKWLKTLIRQISAALIGKDHSDMLPAASWESATLEGDPFLASHLGSFIFWLVADMHLSNIGIHYWQKQQWHDPCRILKMSVNGVSTVSVVAYLVAKASSGSSHA
jgi:hypothetical protein